MLEAPIGIRILPRCQVRNRTFSYKVFIVIFTFVCYTSYHLCRKPISVVKSVLHRNCSINYDGTSLSDSQNTSSSCGWKPFDGKNSATLLGVLDLAFILSYAIGCFVSGHVGERMNLRYLLSAGQILTGFFTMLFGFGYFFEVHSLSFFIIVQILAGLFQSTGWTSVVTCIGNWFGKRKRGFIIGVWNANAAVGKILGLFLAGAFVDYEWGLSFIVPGVVICFNGVLTFLFLVPQPTDVGCKTPGQIGRKEHTETENVKTISSSINEKPVTIISALNIPEITETENVKTISSSKNEKPVSFIGALKIPGVVEFALCHFFTKLVNYTFLFWLPKYISTINTFGSFPFLLMHTSATWTISFIFLSQVTYSASKSAFISVIFDVGGIFGGITSGMLSDITGKSALTCFGCLLLTGPILLIYNMYGHQSLATNIGLSFLCGLFVYGPNTLITMVSTDLGTQQALKDNTKALATVNAIIDGTGSIGAAIGPLLAGVIVSNYGWSDVFYVLIASVIFAMSFLLRLLIKEIRGSDAFNIIRTKFTSKKECDIDNHL